MSLGSVQFESGTLSARLTVADPSSKTTVTIGEIRFNALSAQFGATTLHDGVGLPVMGSVAFTISITADMHDTKNLSFSDLQTLFTLANRVTRDKIKDIKIEFWKDENKNDALCVYSFRGWVSSFFAVSTVDTNHVVSMTLQPEVDMVHFAKITVSN